MTAFNIQNYYIGELTESDETANQAWLCFAKPFSVSNTKWLMRASLPISTCSTPPDGGTYLRSADILSYTIENDAYIVPIGLGIGQVIKKGKTTYNVFIEPQFSVDDDGPEHML